MRKHYDLEFSKQYVADLTTIPQLQFLYSFSHSLPIVEFKISENSNRNLKSMQPIAKKKTLTQFRVLPLRKFGKKNPKAI